MIISDYAVVKYEEEKELGGLKRVAEKEAKLKHIKEVKISNGCLVVRCIRNDVQWQDKWGKSKTNPNVKSVGVILLLDNGRQQTETIVSEDDIFYNVRIPLKNIKGFYL